MDEFVFKWLLFPPGLTELAAYIFVSVGVSFFSKKTSDKNLLKRNLLVFYSIMLISSGFFRTFIQDYSSLFAPPLAIFVLYTILGVFCLFFLKTDFKFRNSTTVLISSALLFSLLVFVFRDGFSVKTYRGSLVEKEKSLKFYNELMVSNRPSKESFLNGHHLDFSFSKPERILSFVEQGFYLKNDHGKGGGNHLDILAYINSKMSIQYVVEVKFRYKLWALDSVEIIGLDGRRFKNFKYMLKNFIGKKDKSLLKNYLPEIDFIKFHL